MDGTNCAVLQAIGSSLQTLLGPNKSVKICVEGEEVGKGLMINDSMKVLTVLIGRVQHPAGHVIHSTALHHHSNHGHGVTSLVCLASSWSHELSDLHHQGIPLPIIFSVFEECLDVCERTVLSLSQSLPQLREKLQSGLSAGGSGRRLLMYSRNFLGGGNGSDISYEELSDVGQRVCHGREEAMQLAVEAIYPQLKTCPRSILDVSKVQVLPLVGVASEHSQVVRGVVCRLRQDMIHIVHEKENITLRTMVVCGDAVKGHSHRGLKGDVKLSVLQSCDLRLESCDSGPRSHDPWLQTWCDTLTKYSIGILAVQGAVSPSLYDHCLSRGIVLLSSLPARSVASICRVSGARAVVYLSQISDEEGLGMARVRVMEGGWSREKVKLGSQRDSSRGEAADYYCCVKPATAEGQCDVTTAILCGHTHSQTDILQCSFQNCLHRLRGVMSGSCTVRGGGWVEENMAKLLHKNAKSLHRIHGNGTSFPHSGSVPYHIQTSWLTHVHHSSLIKETIVSGFAAGLETFAAMVTRALNPDLSLIQALAQVKTGRKYSTMGGGLPTERGASCSSQGEEAREEWEVVDISSCKIASWRSAYQLVRTLTATDYIQQE